MEEAVRRLLARVDVSSGSDCIVFNGPPNSAGYGSVGVRGAKKPMLAHRLMYLYSIAPIQQGHIIHHKCGNKLCINPAHLEALTQKEHLRPIFAAKTHCPQGHEYDEKNTYIYQKTGGRICRKCRCMYVRRIHDRKLEEKHGPNWKRTDGRRKIRCPHGHDYTKGNTHITSKGAKVCKTCYPSYGRPRPKKRTLNGG